MAGVEQELVEVLPSAGAGPDRATSRSPVYRHSSAKDSFPSRSDVTNLYESFASAVSRYPFRNCLGWRPTSGDGLEGYKWLTYKETGRWVERIAAGMTGLSGLSLQPQDKIGVYGKNCKELMVVIQACNRQNLVCVPLYDSLGDQAVEYTIRHAHTRIIFSAAEQLTNLNTAIKHTGNLVKHVVYWGETSATDKGLKELGVSCTSFDSLLLRGQHHPVPAAKATRQDLCTIMYSSGTTGTPKGVMLTHGAILSAVDGQMQGFKNQAAKLGEDFTQEDVMLSFLPLAHIFDRATEELFLAMGASIGYWSGDIKNLGSDIETLRPTLFIGVPRVFDRVREGALATVSRRGPISKLIFAWALQRKLTFLNAGYLSHEASPFTDWLVWRKVNQKLGGRLRLVASGSAPLAPVTRDFLRVAMCSPVIEGYGLTETCGSSFGCQPLAIAQGSVGHPLPLLEFCLESIPEMSYDALASPACGEILIRGPVLFSGYYKDKTKTDEVMDSEGFFHTGDVGKLDEHQQLRIIDRKKSLFKLSQGEYISPEYIESVLITVPTIEQIWVTGQSDRNAAVAIAVPSIESTEVPNGSQREREAFCDSDEACARILAQLADAGANAKLKAFEQIRAVKLETQLWSVETGLLTPTFKLKRPALREKYAVAIEQLYAQVAAKASSAPQIFK